MSFFPKEIQMGKIYNVVYFLRKIIFPFVFQYYKFVFFVNYSDYTVVENR